jgi:hypothetical protein
MIFPTVAPPNPRGPWFVQTWIYIIQESFHVNMKSSSSVALKKKIFKWPHPFLHLCNYLPFEEDLALKFNNLEFTLPKDDMYQVWLKFASCFWRSSFFFNINTCKYGFPYCVPSRPSRTMICINFNLHYSLYKKAFM